MGWSQVGQSQGRGAVVAVWNHAPARPDAPCALPLPLHFLCQSAHDPAACLQGYFSAGTTAPRCARPLGWPAQQVRRLPLPQRTLSGRRSRRQSRSPKRIRAQGRRAAEPPSCVRRHRHHRRRLRDRRLRACAPPPSPRTASDTAASEPTASDPAVSEPAIPSSAAPVAFLCGRSGQSRRRRLLFRRARRLRAERAASVPASTSSAGRLAVCGRSECCHASRGRSALIFPFSVSAAG